MTDRKIIDKHRKMERYIDRYIDWKKARKIDW